MPKLPSSAQEASVLPAASVFFCRVTGSRQAAGVSGTNQRRKSDRRAKRGRRGDDGPVPSSARVAASIAEASPHELADAHVVDVADGASEIAAEEVHEVKAEARSSRDFSRELGDFFDGLGPVAYAQEAPPVDESDDETKTPS